MSSRLPWLTEQVPGYPELHGETLCHTSKQTGKKEPWKNVYKTNKDVKGLERQLSQGGTDCAIGRLSVHISSNHVNARQRKCQ